MSAPRKAAHRKERSSNRIPVALGTVGVVTASVALVAGMVAANASAAEVPTVTLDVDGNAQTVTTTAIIVGEVLAAENVTTDSNDLVQPTPASAVHNGMTITVDHRVQVTVTTPSSTTNHLVQTGSVEAVKAQLGLPTADPAAVSLGATAPSAWTRTVVTRPNGQQLSAHERVVNGSVAKVQQVRIGFGPRTVALRAGTRYYRTPLLPAGAVQVKQRGRNGSAVLSLRRTFINGVFFARQILHRHVTHSRINRVVLRGTGPNWYGLAKCESGNNPRAVNPAGYYGLYQFNLSTWRSVGGRGYPTQATRWEQTKRAWFLYQHRGRAPWPVCGAYL